MLSEVYRSLGAQAPDELAEPIKHYSDRGEALPPTEFLDVQVDGRESTYFEWLGAGIYSPEHHDGSMHGRVALLQQLRYGFSDECFHLRVDVSDALRQRNPDGEFRVIIRGEDELRVQVRLEHGKIAACRIETKDYCLIGPTGLVAVAYNRILEMSVSRKLLLLRRRSHLSVSVALWEGGLPVDLLPAEGWLRVELGPDNFAWPVSVTKPAE